jgi:amino acid adenylation domain-containing protein
VRDINESKNSEILTVVAQQKRRERDYWLNKLSGEIVKSRFPCDHNNVLAEAAKHEAIPFTFPEDISGKLEKVGSGFDPNLFIILAAGVMVLMNKYTGDEDIMVGTPVSKQEIERNFINTVLAIRNRVSGEMSFKELLLQVRQTMIEADENQNYPIETLVYKLNLEFNEHDFPLFDTAVLLENIQDKRYLHPIKPNILFSFSRNDGGIKGELEYNALLYERSTIERIVVHLENLFRAVVFKPNLEIANIEILSDEEKKHLLKDFNDNDSDFPTDKTIYHFLEKHAEVSPDCIAVTYKDEALTYGELNNHSNRLVRVLMDNGIRRDSLAGILLGRSPLMATCILAAWKAGCAYIPMDTNWPPQRILGVLKDSNAAILFTRAEYSQSRLEESFEGRIFLSEKHENTSGEKQPSNPGFKADMKELAYVIYTSGSTGSPKGVMVEHIGMMNHIHAKINDLQLTGKSIIAQNASQCFDISVWQFFSALVPGGKTVIYPDELVLEPPQFLSRIIRDQVTILEVVPSYLSVLLSILDLNIKPLNVLNFLLVTGETVKPGLIRRWFEKYTDIKMVNAYGPTEASDDITHYIMTGAPRGECIPIGRPLQNFNIYIVDEDMNLCPVGVKGELCVSGIGVGRGYLNKPELTAERFISFAHELHELPKDKKLHLTPNTKHLTLYRTGDLARWLPDGTIEFFGRKDYQVKIRGYRIELEEIERKLIDYPGMKEAVVIEKEPSVEDHPGVETSKYLCAFVTAKEKLDIPVVKAYLEEILPGYMIPEYIEQIDQMPLTLNGKVNRKALAQLEISVQDEELTAARNEIERKLVVIWSDVLGIDKETIGINSNFFHLGGHSLKATLLAAKIHKEFNTTIQLKHIFEHPTIRTFSNILKHPAHQIQYIPIEPAERKEYYPLSSAQKRLFFIQQMAPETVSYNLPVAYVIESQFTGERLEEVFRQLIARHENFRTSFGVIGEEPVQRVHEFSEVDFKIQHFHINPGDTASSREASEEIITHFVRPFDLSHAPLLRVGLIDTGDGNWILIIDEHHIITDYTSAQILMRDFSQLYAGKQLPPVRLHYKNYAVFQASEKHREKIKKQEQYWLKEFEGQIPVLDFPTDFPRPEVFNYEGSRTYVDIDGELFAKLKEFILETNTTFFMVLLAVLNVLLSKYTMKEDIVVGTATAGRNHADLENIIGMFINMLALRNYPGMEKTFGQFLEEVKQKVVNGHDNENYQFDELVGKLRLQGDISRNPLFDVVFQLLHPDDMEMDKISGDNLKIRPYERETNPAAHFDLYFEAVELENRAGIMVTYSTALFKKSTIEKIADHYIEILGHVLENKDIKLEEISISHGLFALKSTPLREEEGEFGF